jgi:hypothetical protein
MQTIKVWLLALLLPLAFYCSHSNSAEVSHQMGDDGYVNVPLPFTFPFYGQEFNNSWMYDNGVVSFVEPGKPGALSPWQWSATPLNQAPGTYFIAAAWSDIAPIQATQYLTDGTPTYQKYTWKNISEYYSGGSRLNTFGLEIRPDGSYSSTYASINMNSSNVSVGSVGAPGEYNQLAYYSAGTQINGISDWSVGGVDPCILNPLSSPACLGYQEAYFNQQCVSNPLYNQSCPGYYAAYMQYQCSIDSLYDMSCPGYETAYFQYQCSLDSLYSVNCPGYQTAYHNQQCSLNGLYSTDCSNYEQAYYNQQCSISPLYDSGCFGYTEAYKQKQFDDACKANSQYSPQCPGYTVAVVKESVTVVSVESISTVSTTGNSVVDSVISTPSVTSTTSVSPASVTSQINISTPVVTQTLSVAPAPKSETKTEAKTETKQESKQETKSETKPSSTQQARVEAVKQKQIEVAKNLANSMGEAKSMEAQVNAQASAINAMSYVPEFDVYNMPLKDVPFYKPYEIYKKQKTIDNKRSLIMLQGASDNKHRDMVNSQYKQE